MNGNILLRIAAVTAILSFSPAAAAERNPQMDQVIRQIRETAERMRGQLPPEDIAEMLRNADEMERENGKSSFTAPAAKPAPAGDIIAHLEQVHGSTFEWLMRTATCAGYQWENWRTYTITTGTKIPERNTGCKRAFAAYEQYFYAARNGNGAVGKRHLAEYDRLAHEVVNTYSQE
ncbi:hypothetical protein HMF7854_00145 [Sphingomonas ginkgonis]|uniref:Uncharacterized protein n=2 Tax=Sphingomonas ginkgonis TaxID=2315330 RepID=A0A429V643_9SPHN|nr:hypothetical protein HMF7854_00145 [Sphingomonas ginkgonis]